MLVSYNLTLECNEDGTAKLTGSISGGGMSKILNANLKWEYVSGNQYIGKSGDNSLAIYLVGNALTITVNPKKMGIADFDIDVNVNMKRSTGAVSTATKTPTAVPTTTAPDAIVGSWKGTEDGIASYDMTMIYKADGTGTIEGTFNVMGESKSFTQDVAWEYLNENKYQAQYGFQMLPLQLVGKELIVTLVPSQLGVSASISIYGGMNIPGDQLTCVSAQVHRRQKRLHYNIEHPCRSRDICDHKVDNSGVIITKN